MEEGRWRLSGKPSTNFCCVVTPFSKNAVSSDRELGEETDSGVEEGLPLAAFFDEMRRSTGFRSASVSTSGRSKLTVIPATDDSRWRSSFSLAASLSSLLATACSLRTSSFRATINSRVAKSSSRCATTSSLRAMSSALLKTSFCNRDFSNGAWIAVRSDEFEGYWR